MEKGEIAEIVAKEMEQIKEWCRLLEGNLVEIISKWQNRVGYQSEHLKVYYSGEDLRGILHLEQEIEQDKMKKILDAFCMLESGKMGELKVTDMKKQYCIDVPRKGCEYATAKCAA